ncbi:hypothetical protein [Vibrio owensii]|uniref:hypothetical protein n=1 Tax=Vibrio owensii TaxID=696485 RepID=UPI0018F18987|nr:hypothetical protein [Vibrio owensii]
MREYLNDGFYCIAEKSFGMLKAVPHLFERRFECLLTAKEFLLLNRNSESNAALLVQDMGVIKVVGGELLEVYMLSDGAFERHRVGLKLPTLTSLGEGLHEFVMLVPDLGGGCGSYGEVSVILSPIGDSVLGESVRLESQSKIGPGIGLSYMVTILNSDKHEVATYLFAARYDFGDEQLLGDARQRRFHLTLYFSSLRVQGAVTEMRSRQIVDLVFGVTDHLLVSNILSKQNLRVVDVHTPARVCVSGDNMPDYVNDNLSGLWSRILEVVSSRL